LLAILGAAAIALGVVILAQARLSRSVSPPLTEIGTPVTVDGHAVTLLASTSAAGPNTLSVLVTDEAGAPVRGAAVTIRARSEQMDMGTVETPAMESTPGRYVAADVPLGMGGRWAIEIQIIPPDRNTVTVQSTLDLSGPTS
jgi:hypothetical protein